jgi:hypothetical protein
MKRTLKRRHEVEGQTRRWREDMKLKAEPEVEEKTRSWSQKRREESLESKKIIVLTSQPKPKSTLKLFLLSVWQSRKPPSILWSPWLSHSLHPYLVNFITQPFVQISLRQLETKLRQINTCVVLLIMLPWMVCLCCVTFYLIIVVRRATCVD